MDRRAHHRRGIAAALAVAGGTVRRGVRPYALGATLALGLSNGAFAGEAAEYVPVEIADLGDADADEGEEGLDESRLVLYTGSTSSSSKGCAWGPPAPPRYDDGEVG